MKVAKRDTSEHMSYGWVRAEIVGAFANAVFLIALCFTIIIDAIQRFFEPEGKLIVIAFSFFSHHP